MDEIQNAIIPFIGDESWVEEALVRAKQTLEKEDCPLHAEECEHGKFIEQVRLQICRYPIKDSVISSSITLCHAETKHYFYKIARQDEVQSHPIVASRHGIPQAE